MKTWKNKLALHSCHNLSTTEGSNTHTHLQKSASKAKSSKGCAWLLLLTPPSRLLAPTYDIWSLKKRCALSGCESPAICVSTSVATFLWIRHAKSSCTLTDIIGRQTIVLAGGFLDSTTSVFHVQRNRNIAHIDTRTLRKSVENVFLDGMENYWTSYYYSFGIFEIFK